MTMNPGRSSWLLTPVQAAVLFSAEKSFRGNPILASNALNPRAGGRARLPHFLGCLPDMREIA